MTFARLIAAKKAGEKKCVKAHESHSLEWMSVGRLLNGLEDSFVDAESNGEGENEEGCVS